MRPSIKVMETSSDHPVVVDTALANSKSPLIAAIVNVGCLSGKILSESRLAAFSIESPEKQPVSAEDISKALDDSGFPVENGVVVVRAASTPGLRLFPGGLEVVVGGELVLDHVLSLLGASNAETK